MAFNFRQITNSSATNSTIVYPIDPNYEISTQLILIILIPPAILLTIIVICIKKEMIRDDSTLPLTPTMNSDLIPENKF